jgi:protein LSM12
VVDGEFFGYDQATDCLVLKSNGLYGACTLRMLPGSQVSETLEVKPAPKDTVDMSLPKVDVSRSRAREEEAVRKVEQQLHKIGVGVSREAQNVFEALDKTMSCVWEGRDIIVLDEVRIPAPYTPDACQCLQRTDHAQGVLVRVQKVLALELARLKGE